MKRNRLVNVGLAAALVVTGAGIYTAIGSKASGTAKPTTVDVSSGTVLASVSASGTVVPAEQLSLTFLSSGVVLEVDVKVGDRVTAGQVLAKIDPTSAQQQLTLAQAQLTAAQTNLTSLQSASTSTTSTTPAVSTGSSQAQSQAQAQMQQAQGTLQRDSAKLAQAQAQLGAAQTSFQQATSKVNHDLAFQQQCLANPATPPSGGLTCATVGAQLQIDLASQASAQAAVTAAGVGVATAQQAVAADQNVVIGASAAVVASKSNGSTGSGGSSSGGSTSGSSATSSAGSIAQAEATVTADQINVDNAQKALAATTMTAPAAGTVSSLTGIVGQTVTAGSGAASASGSGGSSGGASSGTGSSSASSSAASSASSSSSSSSSSAFITLTDLNTLQVQASFTEADATKLVVGQKAISTFTALPNVQVQGEVAQIATTSTTSNGVVSFTTLINLDRVPDGLKPGMSATAQVIVGESDNAVFVPASAVTGTGTNGTVTVVNDDGTTTVATVTIGLRGDTTVEVTSGLQQGQKVVRSTAVATSATTGGTGRTGGAGGTGGLTGTGGLGGGGGGAGRIGG